MRAYGPNKSNGLIIQARVMKRHPKMPIHIDKAKKALECPRKPSDESICMQKSEIVKNLD